MKAGQTRLEASQEQLSFFEFAIAWKTCSEAMSTASWQRECLTSRGSRSLIARKLLQLISSERSKSNHAGKPDWPKFQGTFFKSALLSGTGMDWTVDKASLNLLPYALIR